MDGEYNEDDAAAAVCVISHQRVGSLFYHLGELENAMEMYLVELKMLVERFGSDHLLIAAPWKILPWFWKS